MLSFSQSGNTNRNSFRLQRNIGCVCRKAARDAERRAEKETWPWGFEVPSASVFKMGS